MVRSEGNMSLNNPVIPPGIDPGTFRLVAQRLNHYATPRPLLNVTLQIKYARKAEYVIYMIEIKYNTMVNRR
jgi:hypothetical protein